MAVQARRPSIPATALEYSTATAICLPRVREKLDGVVAERALFPPAEREDADRAISNGERKDTHAAQSLEDRLLLGLLAHAGRVADPWRAGTQDGAEKSSSHGMEFLVAVRFLAVGMGLGAEPQAPRLVVGQEHGHRVTAQDRAEAARDCADHLRQREIRCHRFIEVEEKPEALVLLPQFELRREEAIFGLASRGDAVHSCSEQLGPISRRLGHCQVHGVRHHDAGLQHAARRKSLVLWCPYTFVSRGPYFGVTGSLRMPG